jgi:hypothetical protein
MPIDGTYMSRPSLGLGDMTERNPTPNKDECDRLRLRSVYHRDAFLEGLGLGLHFR